MKAERMYIVSILLGLTVAALVGWQVLSAKDTDCFYRSLDIQIAQSKKSKPIDEVLKGCLSKNAAFIAVRNNIRAQRQQLAAKKIPTLQETDKVKAKSAFITWVALLMATAGFAGFVAVQSIVIVWELKPRWNASLIAASVGAAILLALPFVLYLLLPKRFTHLGEFDDLHHGQLTWMNFMGGVLVFPALVGLVAIADVLMSRTDLRLAEAGYLGARMRQLISMLGAALALLVLTTAARWQAIGTLPGGESAPKVVILMWGSAYAVVLAVLYVPAYQQWAAKTGRLISDEVKRQIPDDQSLGGTAGFRSAEMSLTRELNVRLGVGGALASFQGSFAVLAPVIAGAIASLFGS
jgi:hypothetical protein